MREKSGEGIKYNIMEEALWIKRSRDRDFADKDLFDKGELESRWIQNIVL